MDLIMQLATMNSEDPDLPVSPKRLVTVAMYVGLGPGSSLSMIVRILHDLKWRDDLQWGIRLSSRREFGRSVIRGVQQYNSAQSV